MLYIKHLTVFCVCVGFFLIPFNFAHASDADMLDFLPEDEEISGWLRDGDPMLATDLDALTMLINGAAPFYLERGVVEVLFQDYVNDSDVFLTLEIYRTQSKEQARSVYTNIYAENPEAVENLGHEARLMSGLIGAYLLEFWQKTFFIRLTITEKSEYSREAVVNFANHVSNQISQHE
ncbi:hypothetical protein U27_04899 [Candidatus Vecturithrix granuli]|uniref:Uncharacterized protein n=1 Tax=Vecturithrix granuli TaxID=1499967 RepID=A0A081C022_VECG1|nr:hypothetical protein U27_04899 [Candidatus Vecturithrix granuli]